MKITNKVLILKLAFRSLFDQRAEAHQMFTEAIYEFEDDIAEYFKEHLPERHQVYGAAVIAELKDITEHIFKNPDSPKKTELLECLGRLSIAAGFIPHDQQDL